jgi:hypothetical protein
MYTPYFYVIQHIASGKYYAGYQSVSRKKYHSENFMKPSGYQTSSKSVRAIIAAEGLDVFRIRKIRNFKTGAEARVYETRFLTKVGIPHNPRFFNKQANMKFSMLGEWFSTEHKVKIGLAHIGKTVSMETRSKIGKASSEWKRSKAHLDALHTASIKASLGSHRSTEAKAKMRLAKLGKKQKPEHIDSRAASNTGKIRSDEIKAKMKLAWIKRRAAKATGLILQDGSDGIVT